MAIAAAISTPLPSPVSRRSSISFIHLRQPNFMRPTTTTASASPRFRLSASASMPFGAAEKTPRVSFLELRESGFLHFVKYHGLGNDFILVSNRDSSEPRITPEQVVKPCDRNFGIGADGIIFAMPGIKGTDYAMRIFNSDGSEPENLQVDELNLAEIGPKFEHHEMFPARTDTG